MEDLMQKIVSLAKRRGFIFPSSEIYGGLANSFDYGPLGVELKNNIKQEWWKRFVHQRTDIVGIDAALLMNPKVWEASGHIAGFNDPLVECKKCHTRFREDQIANNVCSSCKSKDFTPAKQFNLMLKTFLGPVESNENIVYFRPETAQAMFVDFKSILDTTHRRLPFGIAQVGKAFRNEITPGNFIFRTREFEQMEIEYFVKESDWKKYFEHWLKEMKQWVKDLGVSEKMVEYVEIQEGERAHYSKRTVDIEYKYPFGQKELYGLAYRGDFDLKNHMKASSQDLSWQDPETNEKIVPHVIEPSWGVDRSVLVAMLEAYHEEQAPTAEEGESATRVVMKFPAWLAPVKVAVLPLSKKDELAKVAKEIYGELSKGFVCEYDETQSIGKRYRRQDEIGTPLVITVDFESLKDKKATVRNRDTMKQERIKIKDLADTVSAKLHG
ncbi:MAG: glycine--tRNA ligase [Candidatus Wildermuthbacteria bacterium]|nr:glycine--tRNA ligase [Candidatus Wildermuthbacteria bacterium]